MPEKPILEVFIFIFYLALFILIIPRIPFFKKSKIGIPLLIFLFLLKIASGVAYSRYGINTDTWYFYSEGLKEKNWLVSDPLAFIKDLFIYGYKTPGNIFVGENSYWNDLKSNIPVKIMAIMNVFSFGSYYTNIIFFNFLFLFGPVALFRFFSDILPCKKHFLIIGIFLIPSTLFYCSGIHKDGLLFSALGILIFYFHRGMKNNFTLSKAAIILFCLLLIFTLRNYICLAILPALFAWFLSNKYPDHSVKIFSFTYISGLILFFAIPLILPALDMPAFLANKQHEFLRLQGNSGVITEPLNPGLMGFLDYFPLAMDIAFLRPHFSEIRNFLLLPAVLEPLFFGLLVIYSAIFRAKHLAKNTSVLFLLFFGFSIIIIAGYTITFSGAITRYRSLAYPILITPMLCYIGIPFKKTEPKN